MATAEFNLPDTSTPPDNVYFDGEVISWDFEFDGKKATLGHMQPGLDETFPAAEGGERITLLEPKTGAGVTILELGGEHKDEVDSIRDLKNVGDTIFIPEGKDMRVTTVGKAVQYVCIYPGQPAEE